MKKIRGFGGRTAGLVGWILIVCALASCSLSTDGASSAPVSQVSQSVSEETSQPLGAVAPESRGLLRSQGKLFAEAIKAEEQGGKLYLKGDHIKIYQAEVDCLATSSHSNYQKTEESEAWAVEQLKFIQAFSFAAEQSNFVVDESKIRLAQETQISWYTNPEDPFYQTGQVMLEGTGLPQEQVFDYMRDTIRETQTAAQYADLLFEEWYEEWKVTGEEEDLNQAWEKEQARLVEEILAADHAELC